MKQKQPFIHDDFLLQSAPARELFHRHAKHQPIVDYHCHLEAADIAADRRFANLTEIWLGDDHYKWRAMRAAGIEEAYITGSATDREKFDAYAKTVPQLIRNPLYHWTHMELANPFGIRDRLLSPASASSIWDECKEKLASPGFSVRSLLRHFGVRVVCTTDDPLDNLEHHRALAGDNEFPIVVLPTFRADRLMAPEGLAAWNVYIDELGGQQNRNIRSWDDLLHCIDQCMEKFARHGCRLADLSMEQACMEAPEGTQAERIFQNARNHSDVTSSEMGIYRSALVHELGRMYHRRGWTQQWHIGPLRNVNTECLRRLGPNKGFDTIGDASQAVGLARMLDRLESEQALPRTIIYNLNPADNETFAAMVGNFQRGPDRARIQYGPAWWFLDQKSGIERQLDALANLGLLSRFIGMVTDSRSFLSCSRHDYFRRILCNMLGSEMEQGLIPEDVDMVGAMVEDICCRNAMEYFQFPPRAS